MSATIGEARYDGLAGIDKWSGRFQKESRLLMLFSSIEETASEEDDVYGPSAFGLIGALLYLDSVNDNPITLLINSPGGDISSGMALIQVMRDLKSPVHTIVLGRAASMAAVVAVAGAKRLAYPCARWLLHRGKSGAEGDYEDIEIAAKELRITDTYADQVILNSSKIPPARLRKMQKKDFWLGVNEALKWGIVDEIIQPRQVAWDWIPTAKMVAAKIEAEEEEEEREVERPPAAAGA